MAGWIVIVIIDAHDRRYSVFGHFKPFGLDFEWGGNNYLLGAGLEMPPHRALGFGRVGGRILEDSGGVDHQTHLISLPINVFRISVLAQEGDRHAVDGHCSPGLIQILDCPAALVAMQIHAEPAVGGILFDGSGDVSKTGTNIPS